MTQHINLLVKKNSVSRQAARQILPPILLAFVVPLGLWLLNIDTEEVARKNEAQMRQQAEQNRALLNERLKRAGAGPDTELEALKAKAESAKAMLAKLDELGSSIGHSRRFSALGSVSEPGVWLTAIEITRNGKALAIAGRALDQDSVMRYAEKLGNRFAPEGIVFRGVDVTPENAAPGKTAIAGQPDAYNFRIY